MEDVDGIRGEIDVGEETDQEQETEDDQMEDESKEETQKSVTSTGPKGKCIPTVIEVQDAFEAMNTLRYSQPIHLQGTYRTYASLVRLRTDPLPVPNCLQ